MPTNLKHKKQNKKMANKSAQKKLKQYSGLAENVKKTQTVQPEQKTQQPEEPRLTKDQVIEIFRAFGFSPNETNNDILFWTQQPQSERKKLMDELYKKRAELNTKEETDKATKTALPRLNDTDINALYDEYGIPMKDPEFVRNNLPNDPQKIRAILEMQRKSTDEMLKKEATNMVNAVPETPKAVAQPQGAPIQNAPAPMGAPQMSPEGMPMTQGEAPMTPFFVGDHALVRIINPNDPNSGTLWLVDKQKKILRPILSEEALNNAFEDPEAAKQSITTLSARALAPDGPLAGFTPLNQEKGMQQDGSMKKIAFSPAQIQNHYGKTTDPATENKALSMIDNLVGKLTQ